MRHFKLFLAQTVAVCGLAIPLSVTPVLGEEQRGFFVGAGVPDRGHVHVYARDHQTGSRALSNALNFNVLSEGLQMAQERSAEHFPSRHLSADNALEIRAGFNFGPVLGFLSLEEDNIRGRHKRDTTQVGFGVAVPVNQNLHISGSVTQANDSGNETSRPNIWSLTAGFRF